MMRPKNRLDFMDVMLTFTASERPEVMLSGPVNGKVDIGGQTFCLNLLTVTLFYPFHFNTQDLSVLILISYPSIVPKFCFRYVIQPFKLPRSYMKTSSCDQALRYIYWFLFLNIALISPLHYCQLLFLYVSNLLKKKWF